VNALSIFTGIVYVFLGLGTLWIVGMIVEHILFDL
jgi:hypothetical protein